MHGDGTKRIFRKRYGVGVQVWSLWNWQRSQTQQQTGRILKMLGMAAVRRDRKKGREHREILQIGGTCTGEETIHCAGHKAGRTLFRKNIVKRVRINVP